MFNEKRLRIITGHYGSGKTEFAVNYTLGLAALGQKTAIVDLDIVNPYFRSREMEPFFEKKGIKVVSSSIKGLSGDIPALSPEIYTIFQDKSYQAVIDVGGDKAGATALGRFHDYLDNEPYEMMFVLNANRRMTHDLDGAIRYIREIEAGSRQRITSLINNTHLCGETTIEDVMKGQQLCERVSDALGLPIKYIAVQKALVSSLPKNLKGEIFPIDLYMKKPWE